MLSESEALNEKAMLALSFPALNPTNANASNPKVRNPDTLNFVVLRLDQDIGDLRLASHHKPFDCGLHYPRKSNP